MDDGKYSWLIRCTAFALSTPKGVFDYDSGADGKRGVSVLGYSTDHFVPKDQRVLGVAGGSRPGLDFYPAQQCRFNGQSAAPFDIGYGKAGRSETPRFNKHHRLGSPLGHMSLSGEGSGMYTVTTAPKARPFSLTI